jgi:hypothetical protein
VVIIFWGLLYVLQISILWFSTQKKKDFVERTSFTSTTSTSHWYGRPAFVSITTIRSNDWNWGGCSFLEKTWFVPVETSW